MILTKRLSRTAALGLGLTFFVMAGVDALGFHECPHHDPVAAAPVDQDAPIHHAGHGPSDASTASAPAPADHDGEHGACTCVGTCPLGGQTLAGPSLASVSPPLSPPSGPTLRLADRHVALLPGSPEFFLPFANAPPGPGSATA